MTHGPVLALDQGTTGPTGFLSTDISRGLVWVQPSVFRNQGANTTA